MIGQIEQIEKITKTNYRLADSNLKATVITTEQGSDSIIVKTTITITDEQDYEYVSGSYTYSAQMENSKVLELVSKAFEQASSMKYAPSKFGEDVPEITTK